MSAPPAPPVPGLLPDGYRTASRDLPRARAPGWMSWIWVASSIATVVVAGAILIGPMDETVLATGVVRPADYTLVFPQVGGAISEVMIQPGAQVAKGALLARIDDHELDQEVVRLTADRASAEAERTLSSAQLIAVREVPVAPDLLFQAASIPQLEQLARIHQDLLKPLEGLGHGKDISMLELTRERLATQAAELELQRARQARELLAGDYAKAQVVTAEARLQAVTVRIQGLSDRLRLLEATRERYLVRAPADGLVLSGSVRFPGERVEIGTALFKLAQGTATRLRLQAGEDRVDRIRPGMTVRFRSRSDPDRLAPMSQGRVAEVALDRALVAESGAGPIQGGIYAIDVEVDPQGAPLPFGAAVDAEILLGTRPFWQTLRQTMRQGR